MRYVLPPPRSSRRIPRRPPPSHAPSSRPPPFPPSSAASRPWNWGSFASPPTTTGPWRFCNAACSTWDSVGSRGRSRRSWRNCGAPRHSHPGRAVWRPRNRWAAAPDCAALDGVRFPEGWRRYLEHLIRAPPFSLIVKLAPPPPSARQRLGIKRPLSYLQRLEQLERPLLFSVLLIWRCFLLIGLLFRPLRSTSALKRNPSPSSPPSFLSFLPHTSRVATQIPVRNTNVWPVGAGGAADAGSDHRRSFWSV